MQSQNGQLRQLNSFLLERILMYENERLMHGSFIESAQLLSDGYASSKGSTPFPPSLDIDGSFREGLPEHQLCPSASYDVGISDHTPPLPSASSLQSSDDDLGIANDHDPRPRNPPSTRQIHNCRHVNQQPLSGNNHHLLGLEVSLHWPSSTLLTNKFKNATPRMGKNLESKYQAINVQKYYQPLSVNITQVA